jgi:hypothetical protein
MALNQTSLDPRSRPGTIFTGLGINPYEVWQGRVQQEADAAKLAAAKKAQEDAVKKAQLEAGKVEFGKVYREHSPEFTQATNAFLQADAERVRKFNTTKNPDDDIFTYGSRAWDERQQQISTLKIYSEHSQQQQAIAEKFETEMINNPGKYTQEDINAIRTLVKTSPFEVMYAGIDVSNPDLYGHWDKQKTLTDAKSLLDKEGWGNATYDEASDMFTTQSGEKITPLRVKQTAIALTDPKSQSGMRWAIEIQGMSDEEKKRLEGEAEKMSKELGVPVSAAAAKAYEDMKQFIISSSKETKSRAGFVSSAGYGEKEMADRFVKAFLGLSSNDPELLQEYYYEFSGDVPGIPKGAGVRYYKSDVFNGYRIGGTKEDPITIKSIYKVGNMTYIETDEVETITETDGTKRKQNKIYSTPTEQFATNYMEPLQEYNTELKKPPIEKRLKEMQVVTPGGAIIAKPQRELPKQTGVVGGTTSGTPSGTTASLYDQP